MEKTPHVDVKQVGEADKRNLCDTFLSAVQRFYDDPRNRDLFERWKMDRHTTQPVTVTQ